MNERRPRVLRTLLVKPREIDLAFKELEVREGVKRKWGETSDDWDYRRREEMSEVRRIGRN